MKPTKLSSIKDTFKCSATPLVPTSDLQEPGLAVSSLSATSHQLHNKTADSITDILFSSTASNQAPILQSARDRDKRRRNTATSSRTRSKGLDLSPLSFNRESVLASPTLPVSGSRRSTTSPAVSPREPNIVSVPHPATSRPHAVSKDFSVPHPATSRPHALSKDFSVPHPATPRPHAVSKDFASYLELDTKSINTGLGEEIPHRKGQLSHSHRLSAFPFREIFSPIPSEHVGDEGLQDFSNDATWRRPDGDHVVGRSRDPNFPAIKVEDCDEGWFEKESSGIGDKDFAGMKKSASVPSNSLGELGQSRQDASRQKTTSLDVPSSYIKWRTAEGRLIAAMNEDLLTGALSRLCSRSEGNIPLILQDTKEHIHGLDSKTNQAENNSSLSRQFSRHVPQYLSRNCPRSPNRVVSINSGRQERILLTPSLQRQQMSRTQLVFSSGTLEADMKKDAEFMAPQPPRRQGPRF